MKHYPTGIFRGGGSGIVLQAVVNAALYSTIGWEMIQRLKTV